MSSEIKRIAVIGTGVIGASWAALFLAKGLDVTATDPAPNAENVLRKFAEAAWPTLQRLGLAPGASLSKLKFTTDLAKAVAGADLDPDQVGVVTRVAPLDFDHLDAALLCHRGGVDLVDLLLGMAPQHAEEHLDRE